MFSSRLGEDEKRRCPDCGAFTTVGMWEKTAAPEEQAAEPSHRVKRIIRKRRGLHLVTKIILGWIAVIGVIVLLARMFRENAPPPHVGTSGGKSLPAPNAADQSLLTRGLPECAMLLRQFIAAQTVNERARFVNSPGVTLRMDDFYSKNFISAPKIDEMVADDGAITTINGKKALELRLSQPKTGSRSVLDAVFYREDNEWFLDWDAFVLYSGHPWPLFLAGSGPDEADFRLYARERLPETFRSTDTLSLVFYAPRFGRPDETGSQSPEFMIPRDSENGRLAAAGFRLAAEGKRPFASRLPSTDPDGLIRMRVRIRRIRDGDKSTYQIVKIYACHWYGVDESGMPAGEAQSR